MSNFQAFKTYMFEYSNSTLKCYRSLGQNGDSDAKSEAETFGYARLSLTYVLWC